MSRSTPDLKSLAAGMIGIGFGGTEMSPEARSLIERGVRNVIFFARNATSPEQFAALTRQVKSVVAEPVMTHIDQEGGRVMRLREPFTIVPSMRDVGRAGDAALAFEIGRVLGRELRAVNIDVDLAPVLDVDTNPGNPVISSRSFGPSTEVVARLGVAVMRGLQDAAVAACAKHFPGHGDTSKDSHKELPTLPHDVERLLRIELPPFKAAIDAGVASVMTAHVIYSPLDAYPGTLSRAIIDGLLRKRFGYDGYVMSDDMQMKAIADHYGFDDAIVLAVNAGVDLLWICHSWEMQNRAIEVLTEAVETGVVPRKRLEDASRRMHALAAKYYKPAAKSVDLRLIGTSQHQGIAQRVLELAGERDVAIGEDPTEQFVRQQKT